MKKVALTTIYNVKNFGAVLQAYATYRAITKLGHNVELVDIRLDVGKSNLKGRIALFFQDFKFKRFFKKFFPCKTQYYQTIDELQANPPMADTYVVGSDQVWNLEITRKIVNSFLLDFGANNTRRLSYASSFGLDKWNNGEKETELFKSKLSKFDAISTREESGSAILKEVFNLESNIVLDPTMLFNEYEDITGSLKQKNEIVCYKFIQDSDFYDVARYMSKNMNMPVRLINNIKPKKGLRYTYPPSIKTWVRSIAQSSFVITDSFHGLAFSLIYKKDFVVFIANPLRATRLINLLKTFDLLDRLFYSYDDIYESNIWENKIDYTIVDKKLNDMRIKSWSFLENNI